MVRLSSVKKSRTGKMLKKFVSANIWLPVGPIFLFISFIIFIKYIFKLRFSISGDGSARLIEIRVSQGHEKVSCMLYKTCQMFKRIA